MRSSPGPKRISPEGQCALLPFYFIVAQLAKRLLSALGAIPMAKLRGRMLIDLRLQLLP